MLRFSPHVFLSNTSFNGIRLRHNEVVPLLLCFSKDVIGIKRHESWWDFAVRGFSVHISPFVFFSV